MGLAAFVAATALIYSFSETPKQAAKAKWFTYNGNGESDPNNYEAIEGVPECEDTEGTLCAIHAQPGVGNHPDLSTEDGERYKP